MNRKEFLEKIGIGAAFALTATCLGGCAKDTSEEPVDVDFTINLDDEEFSILNNLGEYKVHNAVVIARSEFGEQGYLAASVTCSHESLQEVTYDNNNAEWFCTAHGARYDLAGGGLNTFGEGGLTIYQTSLVGRTLRIFS